MSLSSKFQWLLYIFTYFFYLCPCFSAIICFFWWGIDTYISKCIDTALHLNFSKYIGLYKILYYRILGPCCSLWRAKYCLVAPHWVFVYLFFPVTIFWSAIQIFLDHFFFFNNLSAYRIIPPKNPNHKIIFIEKQFECLGKNNKISKKLLPFYFLLKRMKDKHWSRAFWTKENTIIWYFRI